MCVCVWVCVSQGGGSYSYVGVYLVWNLLSFLSLLMYIFFKFEKKIAHYLKKYFFRLLSSSFLSRTIIIHVRPLLSDFIILFYVL